MKKTKRFLPLFSLFALLVSCGQTSSSSSVSEAANTAPIIEGVQEEVSIHLEESFNALEGVTANDAEDGNLTDQIVISSIPALVNNEGVLTPDAEGDYYLTYTVTDSGGLVYESFSTLTVTAKLPIETLFQEYLFAETYDLNMDGWQVDLSQGAVATYSAQDGCLALEVTNLGLAPEDVALSSIGQAVTSLSDYTFSMNLFASVASHVRVVIAETNVTEPLVSQDFNLTVEEGSLSVTFTPQNETSAVDIKLFLGATLNTDLLTLFVSTAKMTSSTGTEIETIFVSDSFAEGHAGWDFNVNSGAVAGFSSSNQDLAFDIQSYAGENNPWNINLFRVTDTDLVAGHLYRIRFTMTVAQSQFFELCFEDYRMDWQVRAGFRNGTFSGTTNFSYDFTASMNITDLYIKLAIGKGSVSTNNIQIDDFIFAEVTGDQVIEEQTHDFVGNAEDALWETFNGEGGEGNLYAQDGILHYDISAFGTNDWHNKMFIKQLSLDSLASYRFEISIQADKTLQGNFIVNQIGAWNPQINETIEVTATAQTLSFATEKILTSMDIEILFQFGGFANNIAPASIQLTTLKVFKIA